MKNERKIPLLNEFECRGRIIGKGGLNDFRPYLTLFIKTKRRPAYLRIYFDPAYFFDFDLNQHIIVNGFVKSNLRPYCYYGKKDQYLFADSIEVEKTVLKEAFEIPNLGFAYNHSYSKVFLSGTILSIVDKDGWITIQVRDYKEQVISLQYSHRMRVSDLTLALNDFVFISAFVVSKRKVIKDAIIHFEDLIVDDIAVN